MGVTEHTVQAAGPRPSGGGVVAAIERLVAAERGQQRLVKVTWTVVQQYETVIPASWWERFDGAEGPTGERPIDGILTDLEGDLVGDVIERNVDQVEAGS